MSLRHLISSLSLLIALLSVFSVDAQDLDKINEGKLLKANGGVSVSTVFYDADGIDNRRDPFYWKLNANMNFNVGGVSILFSASLSQQQKSFTQPFNQVGFSPTYKAWTAHVGYRSMSFSPYTLGGKTFLGVGLEYKPKGHWVQASILYGRFTKAVEEGGNDGTVVGIRAYERYGYGAKVRLGSNSNHFALSVFRGRDDENSIAEDTSSSITPAENLVWSLYTKQKIAKKVTFDFEYAFSAYTRDVRNDQEVLDNFNYYNNIGGVFTPNATTQYNKAIVTNLTFTQEKYNVKLSYKRIDPEYLSMGTPFLNNDLENLTAGLSWKMFKKKLGITTTGGFQRNNLDNLKASDESRLAMGVNMTYTFKKKLNLAMNYSNFTSKVQQEQFLDIDSLDFFQNTSNVSFRANYKLESKKKIKRDVIFSVNVQNANDTYDNKTTISNNNLGYKQSWRDIGLTAFISMNYNKSIFQGLERDTYGPTLNMSKTMLKKKVVMKLTVSTLARKANGIKQNNITNYRYSVKYNHSRHQSLSLNATWVDRISHEENQTSFTEKTLTLQYAVRF